MDAASVKAFAQCVGTKVENITAQGWANCKCPLAPFLHDSGKDSNPSFAIKVHANGESRFQCYTCEKGDLLYLVQLLKGYGAKAPRYDLKQAMEILSAEANSDLVLKIKDFGTHGVEEEDDGNNDAVFDENWLHGFKKAALVPRAMDYLTHRGLSPATITELDIRYDLGKDTVCFPIRDALGFLCGLRGRYIEPDEGQPSYHMYKNAQKHYNRKVWQGEFWVDFDKPVLMVESVFDHAAVFPHYQNVLAPLTVGMSSAKVKRVSSAFDIVTLFDKGKGGDKARALIQKYLPDAVQTHLLPAGPHRLKPDREAKDPGEMQTSAILELLAPHVVLESPV